MIRRPALLVAVLGLALAVPSTALGARAKVSLLAAESQLICTSCHEPLELAQSPQAQNEKAFVAGLVDQGLDMQQIKARMVANYGITVLGKPPAHGFNLTVYILPPALLVVGIVFLVVSLPKWRARARATRPLEGAPPLGPDDAARLEDDLARFV